MGDWREWNAPADFVAVLGEGGDPALPFRGGFGAEAHEDAAVGVDEAEGPEAAALPALELCGGGCRVGRGG